MSDLAATAPGLPPAATGLAGQRFPVPQADKPYS